MIWRDEDGIDSEISQIFYQDSYEKKNIGRNIYHRAATRKGRLNKMFFASDFMSKKEKKDYKKNGKVVCSNMYELIENIPSLEELRKMDKKSATKLIMNIKEKFNVKELSKHWGVSAYYYYKDLQDEFDLPKKSRNGGIQKGTKLGARNKAEEKKTQEIKDEVAITMQEPKPENVIILHPENQPVIEKDFEGFQIKFGGTYLGEKLSDRIMNYISMLDKNSKYKIKFLIEEIADLTQDENEQSKGY